MIRDPLNQRAYTKARAAWLAGYQGGYGTCCLCGKPVDTSLPGRAKWGPTIEHTVPIRTIRALSTSNAQALAWALDTSLWRLAHQHCQRRQGGAAAATTRRPPRTAPWRTSRAW